MADIECGNYSITVNSDRVTPEQVAAVISYMYNNSSNFRSAINSINQLNGNINFSIDDNHVAGNSTDGIPGNLRTKEIPDIGTEINA